MNEVEFTALYSETIKLVRSIIYRYSSRTPIDDLTQKTYIRAWRFRHETTQHQSIKSWIAKIAVNLTYDWGRKIATQINLQLVEIPGVQSEIFEKIRLMKRQEQRNKIKAMVFKTSLLTCLATAASLVVAVISWRHSEKEQTQIVWEKECSSCGDYLDAMIPILAANESQPRR